jgi:hypothetical protein
VASAVYSLSHMLLQGIFPKNNNICGRRWNEVGLGGGEGRRLVVSVSRVKDREREK